MSQLEKECDAMTKESVQEMLAELRTSCGYSDGEDGEESDTDSLIAYKDALEDAYGSLLGSAPLPAAIERVQNMRDAAAAYFEAHDVPGEWLDEDGSWTSWAAEAEGSAAEAKRDTLDAVLDVLQILAHGGTPAQGAPVEVAQ